MENYYKTIIYFIGLALSNLSANFLPRKSVVIERAPGNVSFSILETCYRTRSELPHSALPVDMSMTQHLSLWDFLAVAVVGTNVRTSLIPPPAGKKNQSPYPPRPTYHDGKLGGGMFGNHDAGFVGTLTPSTMSRFCSSDIPAE